ncbi:hypothetical protein [Caballeronia sordidicola]|uniref:hypothetical protein n=1 Tax=Caballeronia sordidicola TaxID=196367 RepID=UPI0015C66C02|nr:hypothetical protein [Caballeronia sordidicola]
MKKESVALGLDIKTIMPTVNFVADADDSIELRSDGQRLKYDGQRVKNVAANTVVAP